MSAETATQADLWKPSEKELQQLIVKQAKLLGFMVFHPYDSRRSTPGFPDLTLVKDGRIIFAELKTAKGTVSTYQQEWIDALGQIEGTLQVVVWRPEHWLSGEVESVLKGDT
jgi:hypothetical protein